MGFSQKILSTGSLFHLSTEDKFMAEEEPKTKNPYIKLGSYFLIAMVVGIGAAWVLLGIISPVLLILLIQRW
jgi:hypothetical protein